MLAAATLLRRLEALERNREEGPEVKVFILYAERNPPFWKPEEPEVWRQSNPRGHAILLTRRICRI
jgi:hypothetical protein